MCFVQNRLVEGAEQGLIETLRALGLDYDEGQSRMRVTLVPLGR